VGQSDTIETIDDILTVNGARYPRRTALQEMDESGWLRPTSYAELEEQVDAFVCFLKDQGGKRKDRIAIVMPNSRRWVVGYFAVLKLGAIAVPLEYDFVRGSTEYLRFPLENAGVRFALCDAEDADAIRAIAPRGVEGIISVSPGELPRERDAPGAPARIMPSDVAQILYTSGTTGRRKGVSLTHRNILFDVEMCCRRFRVHRGDSLPALLPFHHAYPLTTTVVLPLYAGARMTVGDFRSKNVRQLLSMSRPTVLVGVPRAFQGLLAAIEHGALRSGKLRRFQKAKALSAALKRWTGLNVGRLLFRGVHRRLFGGMQLRFCVSGGARLPARVIGEYLKLGIPMLQGWGMTEISPVGTAQEYSRFRFYFTRHYERKAGSVGTPLDGTEIALADCPAQDVIVARDGKGEMLIRGPHVMKEYHADPGETLRRKLAAGLRSGDIARVDAAGNFFIVGRAKHVIVLPSGKKVFPEEDLYEELLACPCIEEFAVRAIRDENGAEKIGIVIKPDREALAARGVATVGEMYEATKAELTAALQQKPAYVKRFDFCLTEWTGSEFRDLIKSAMKEPCPTKNVFRLAASYARRRGSNEPIDLRQ